MKTRSKQRQTARLEIVSQLYLRGYTVRDIRDEVMKRLGLRTYSTETVQRDTERLLAEWREERLSNMDDALQLEITRIHYTIRELWAQWEKSKEDYMSTNRKRKGSPSKGDAQATGDSIKTLSVEESSRNVVGLGNPAYIAEIRQQLMELRKLLGLYAPEKKNVQSEVTVQRSPCDMSVEEIEAEIKALKLDE